MSNCINRLVQYINSSLNGYCDKDTMDMASASISVMYAIKKLSNKKLTDSDLFHGDEYNRLKSSRFGELVSYYDQYIGALTSELLAGLDHIMDNLLSLNADDANMVSWIYQKLKNSLSKETLKKIGTGQNKLTGTDMLIQTQFFTDHYMVKFLVDKVFDLLQNDLPNVVFIDPACGGGNFLTYIYDKLFDWYSKNTPYQAETINSLIIKNNIIGYDLDKTLSQIASLSLYICGRLHSDFNDTSNIYIFGGETDDGKGFLTENIKSNRINGKKVSELMSDIRSKEVPVVYITNPPFMGKRDMDTNLKEYLLYKYPNSKGDLCFSFMEQILQRMRSQDIFASVTQNGWLSLSTLKGFRKNLLDNFFLHTCVDMGTNAFESINGEKTNIVLSVIKGTRARQNSTFANLRGYKFIEKKELLQNGNYNVYSVNMENFRNNANYEFCYQLGSDMERFKSMPLYGEYGKCMQGSSTGDNKTMVKYLWETDDPNWVLASKGGGYSKWEGLNLYKVKWGKQGELLKNNKGSALRNPSEMDKTALVYSDTGTLGLCTRLRLDGQVFIASGPGIKVLRGIPLCHLAFLNSKISTYFLKVLNPKFTISAGYISKIPVADGIIDNDFLARLAGRCVHLKNEYLSSKLPNLEFSHDDYEKIIDVDSYIENRIRQDVFNQYQRHLYEQEINNLILEKYQLSENQKNEYNKMTGGNMVYNGTMPDLKTIDHLLASTLNESCQSVSRKLNGHVVGTENCLDMMSYIYSLPQKEIARYILSNVKRFSTTKQLYTRDLIHKLALKTCGITDVSHVQVDQSLDTEAICEKIKDEYKLLFGKLNITTSLISDIIENVHKKCFFSKPILKP